MTKEKDWCPDEGELLPQGELKPMTWKECEMRRRGKAEKVLTLLEELLERIKKD